MVRGVIYSILAVNVAFAAAATVYSVGQIASKPGLALLGTVASLSGLALASMLIYGLYSHKRNTSNTRTVVGSTPVPGPDVLESKLVEAKTVYAELKASYAVACDVWRKAKADGTNTARAEQEYKFSQASMHAARDEVMHITRQVQQARAN